MARWLYALVLVLLGINGLSFAIDCPDSCECFKAPDSLIEANCTDLEKLHKYLNSKKSINLDILKLSDPFITSINGQLDKLTGISVLDLSGNNLNSVKKLPKSVIKLDLSDNFLKNIEELPYSLRELNLRGNKLKELSFTISNLQYLRRLFLENNSLSCSCETIQVRDWLIKNYVSIDKPVCMNDHGKSVPLSEVKTSDVCLKIKRKYELDDLMLGDDPLGGGAVFQGSGSEPEDDEDLFLKVSTTSPPHKPHDDSQDIYEGSGLDQDVIYIDKSYDEFDEGSTFVASSETTQTTEQPLKKPISPIIIDEDEGSGSGSGDGAILPITDDDDDDDNFSFFVSEIPTTMEPVTSSNKFSDWSLFDWIVGRKTTEEVTETTPDPKFDEEKEKDKETNENQQTTEILVTEAPFIAKVNPKLDTEVIQKDLEEKSEDTSENIELGNVKSEKDEDNTTTYACLGVLSLLLILLIIFVIIKKRKSDKRRKRQQKRDVENRGTEMRDMNKKLIEQNQVKPKVNGNFETVPLVTNGEKKPIAQPRIISTLSDTKPEPSKNGKALEQLLDNPKKNDIETYDNVPLPKSVPNVYQVPKTDTLPVQSVNDIENSSNDYKVKIKLKENPESLPKTPVLVTRTRSNAGDIILTPVNKNGVNGNSAR